MIFSSLEFLCVFLPITLFGFLVLRNKGHISLSWLVLCSLAFYGWWNPIYLALLFSSILVNYLIAIGLRKYSRPAKALLVIGIFFNLGLLGWFKYADFFINNINWIFNTDATALNIVLPLAISFFTFQQIAFLVDCYRGVTHEHQIIDYTLFVSFFPQLIAGPIVHHNDVLPQFRKLREQPYDFTNLQIGLTALTIGLFKKLVIADGLSEAVAPIFAASDQGIALPTLYAWLGALCYTFQLYFDFSGYSDMAIGAARLFGIRLPENFYSPYKSTSIIEFWRRWHMTLSRFLRDYLYISLGGNRKGYPRQLTNLMFTMLLGGLWHGAGWTFVIWGALHGTYLVINHLWMRYGGQLRNGLHNRLAYRSASSCLCFVAIVIAWVLFRSASLDGAFSMLNSMLYDFNLADKTPRFAEKIPTFTYILLPAAMAIAWLLPNTQQWMVSTNLTLSTMPEKKTRIRWSPSWYWAVFTGSLAVASFYKLIYMPNAITEFIYFQF